MVMMVVGCNNVEVQGEESKGIYENRLLKLLVGLSSEF
ncbi:hypothetical protein Q7M_1534 (plasmid) [Borrelia crocidurae str. Achema]|uniref:Variable outer membrane protein n=1 Tax=Borrelia crocidurae (strain Achema) TaxID=1155096 RepID=I0FDX1_BORCA|nr:hypothetical protein Q7M_1534 [Borrelia crocidurae str. Achema]